MQKQVKSVVQFPAKVLVPVKNYLLNEQKRLMRKKSLLRKEDPYADRDRLVDKASADDNVSEMIGHERVMAIKSEVDKALINIRKALTKIKVGSYGSCESCGRMIDTDRLAINPTASLCMSCEEKAEKKS